MKFVIRCASSVVSAGLSRDVNGRQHHETVEHEPFNVPLSSWIPYLFVNPHDPICSEYIGYFEQRKKTRAKRLGGVDRFLTKSCMDSGSEPLHLIPSADLTINRCQLTEFQGPFLSKKNLKELMEFNSGGIMFPVILCVMSTTLQTMLNEAVACANRPKRLVNAAVQTLNMRG